jgi:hypothetical protein
VSIHRNLQVQFFDISSQLLVGIKPTPISCSFPNLIPDLTIDLATILLDPALAYRHHSLGSNYNKIAFVNLAPESLDVAIGLTDGSVFVCRLDAGKHPAQSKDKTDPELIVLDSLAAAHSRYNPYFLLSAGNSPLAACSIADSGTS